jgi:hypothetical protein
LAVDGLQLSANAAKEWRGTFAELRQKQEQLEQTVKTLLAEQSRADQEGEPSRTAEQDKGHEPIQRLEKQAARIETFLPEHEPTRGKRGKA